MVGRIPDGPHRLAEARAHLAREIAGHQAKLDRHAAIIAAGGRPMGRPPVPMEQSTRVLRARRVVQAAERAASEDSGSPSRRGAGKHRKPKHLPDVVANTTDPQSRIMPTRKGFLQGYNAQLAVSADHVIVAVSLSQSTNDQACFVPMMHAAQHAAASLHAQTGSDDHLLGTVLADAGYASDANLAAAGPDRLIALGKGRDQSKAAAREPAQTPPPSDATIRQADGTPPAHRGRTHPLQTARSHRGTGNRQPQDPPRPVLPPRPERRTGRTPARGDRLQPPEDLPSGSGRLTPGLARPERTEPARRIDRQATGWPTTPNPNLRQALRRRDPHR